MRSEPTPLRELRSAQRQAAERKQRARRGVWLSFAMGVATWVVLITWAALGPRLGERTQLAFGFAVATEASAMGFLLAVYAHRSQMREADGRVTELTELARGLKEASARDSLTGLYNHGYVMSRLQDEISRARRHKSVLSVVIIDLDDFKDINDLCGHLVGDEVLTLIAGCVRAHIGQHAVAARYGGDEFCMILPNTDRVGAQAVTDKLSTAIGRLEVRTGKRMSFAAGIANFPENGDAVRSLVLTADKKLHEQKRSQRRMSSAFFGRFRRPFRN